jgi:hypothetical protein
VTDADRYRRHVSGHTDPATIVLWDLLVALDAAAADVWLDGSPWQAGVREGLERAAVLVRGRLAYLVETEDRR